MSDAKVKPKEEKAEVDPRLQNGPIEERHCTDILCCLLFIAGNIALLYIAIFGWNKGDPRKLVALYEASNKSCALDLPEYKYLYFPLPHPDWLNKTTCVTKCPVVYNYTELPTVECHPNILVPECSGQCSPIKFEITDGTDFKMKQDWLSMFCVYNTTTNRICWPSPEIILNLGKQFAESMSMKVNTDTVAQWIDDLGKSWPVIAGSVGIALGLGLVYMLFLRLFSGIIVWACILLYLVCLALLGFYCYQKAKDIEEKQKNQDFTDQEKTEEEATAKNTEQNRQTYLYTGYIIWALCGVSALAIVCMYDKIRLAIAIIKTATLYVIDVPLSMLVPPIFSIFIAVWWLFWIFGMVYLYSTGEPSKRPDSPFAQMTHDETTQYYLWYFIFGGLWGNAFIQATSQFILASSVCIWYFSQGKDGELHMPIFRSIYRAFRYHLGSLAFGAFILAVVQFIRIVLEYVNKQMKQTGADKNKVLKCIMNYLRCCMACFERFIRFLNRNAYIQIALTGKSFCFAAKDAMRMIWANPVRMSLVNGLGGAFIWIGKLFIMCATVLICYQILLNASPYKETVSSPYLSCLIILVISYAIAMNFMSVYGMAIDAILMCFLNDEELAKGRGNAAPQHCPELLKSFFETNEKK